MIETAILEKEAMQLPEVDRAMLANRLIQSLSRTSTELIEEWVEEADNRMNAYRAGDISAVDGPTALKKLRSNIIK